MPGGSGGTPFLDSTTIRLTRRLSAQQAVTSVLAESDSLVEVMHHVLSSVCAALEWKIGAFWRTGADEFMRCEVVGRGAHSDALASFDAGCRALSFRRGEGIVGRVWAEGDASWIPDLVATDEKPPLVTLATGAGLHAAFGFPIREGKQVVGVMAFFNSRIEPPDLELLDMMTNIGLQLGQFLRRGRAQEAVRASEARKAAILEAAIDAIVSIDHEGLVIEWNCAAEQMFGYTADEATGRKMVDLIVPPAARDAHLQGFARYLATGTSSLIGKRIELTARRADSSEFPVELAMARIRSDASPMFTAYIRDISERKRLQAERAELLARERAARADAENVAEDLERERQEAETANRLKDEFLATVSHELRTPLNAILGWTTMLRTNVSDATGMSRGLETIERNARAQARLIEDVLDVSRIIAGKLRLDLKATDMAAVVKTALETVKLAADLKGIVVDASLPAEPCSLAGDPDRLQQVVWNLLSNAIKFTPRGGRIIVRVARDESTITVEVTDTGQGIHPEFLPHVFERFRQEDGSSKRRHSGLGLGLAIAHHLVDLHRGKIRVTSDGEGKGAKFIVELPVAAIRARDTERSERAVVRPVLARPAQIRGRRILVVDDEEDARDLLVSVLEHSKAIVTSVANVAEAIEAFHRFRPDIVISDIGLPTENGYDLIRKIRSLPPGSGGKTPAVALTAYARKEDRTLALDAGFDSHLAKPIELKDLLALVATLCPALETIGEDDDEFGGETVRYFSPPLDRHGPLPTFVHAHFEIVTGTDPGKAFPLSEVTTTLGRDEGVQICIRDSAVSRQHATITYTHRGFRVADLKSANGLRLNGVHVRENALTDGDVLQLGATRLLFHLSFDPIT